MVALKNISFFALTLLLLGNCGSPSSGSGCSPSWTASSDQLLGSQAPNFVLPNLVGEKVELQTLANQKPTLIIFWATWCPTCVEEIPVLNAWTEKYPQLQILAVNVQEPPARVRTFAKKQEIRYPVVFDEEAEVAHMFGLVGIPAAVLLAKGGKVIYYGFALPKNVEQLIGS